MTDRHDAFHRLEELPRTRLAHLPTPLRPLPGLRRALGAGTPPLLLKDDELTGFGLGGNKVRKMEHELAPDRLDGVTHLITTGGAQSNHCRVTAAAAARLGLGCVLVVNGEPGDPPRGNALLHRLLGAEVRTVTDASRRPAAMEEAAADIEREGGRALTVPLGASTARGALGYVRAASELDHQLASLPDADGPTVVYLASSSAGTLGGLTAGFTLLGRRELRLVGVSADVPADELVANARTLAEGALAILGATREIPHDLVDATDREVGPGYGIPTAASREATDLLARTEGVILDPTYTSKAVAGLLRHARAGRLVDFARVVFLHTGGHPALFA